MSLGGVATARHALGRGTLSADRLVSILRSRVGESVGQSFGPSLGPHFIHGAAAEAMPAFAGQAVKVAPLSPRHAIRHTAVAVLTRE